MQQYSNLRDPRHPRPRFRRIEVNMPLQPCHQQRWRAPRRSTSNISSEDARNREPAPRHHTKVGDLLLQAPLQAKPARVLPQYDERSHSTSLDSQPIHGGADATGQSAIANDATAPTHRRRNPGESLHGGPTRPEPAIPPVAVGHKREPIRQGLRRYVVNSLSSQIPTLSPQTSACPRHAPVPPVVPINIHHTPGAVAYLSCDSDLLPTPPGSHERTRNA